MKKALLATLIIIGPAMPAASFAALPSWDYANFGARLIENIKTAARENEKQILLIKKMGQATMLHQQEIMATNNQAANTVIRTNQQKADVQNLEVASQAVPVAGSCLVVANGSSAELAQQAAKLRAQSRDETTTEETLGRLAALSDPSTAHKARAGQLTNSIGDRIKDAHDKNMILSGQANGDDDLIDPLLVNGMSGTIAQPWETHRFFNQERIEGDDLVAARDMVDILFPPSLPNTLNYSSLKGDANGDLSFQRNMIMKSASRASLNGVIDQFVPTGAEGLPSPVETKANTARAFYSDADSFSNRVGDGSVQSIHEVNRGRALMMASTLRDKLDGFKRELEQEAAMARLLAGELKKPQDTPH